MMALWIKICGLKTAAAVDAAIAAGASAVGFVFAPSPRQIALDDAGPLIDRARGRVDTVAVMRHPEPAYARSVCMQLRPDYLQTDVEDFVDIDVPSGVTMLPVFRRTPEQATPPSPLLFEGADSGTGEVSDWAAAAALATRTRLVLAGGLNVDNVAAGIARVAPYGVDVSSGVERRRGDKDFTKIGEFVRAARAASPEA